MAKLRSSFHPPEPGHVREWLFANNEPGLNALIAAHAGVRAGRVFESITLPPAPIAVVPPPGPPSPIPPAGPPAAPPASGVPDARHYLFFDLLSTAAEAQFDALLQDLRTAWAPFFESAYIEHAGDLPAFPTSPADAHFVFQGYLTPEPTGIGATEVWHRDGADGTGVRLAAVERGWAFKLDTLTPAEDPIDPSIQWHDGDLAHLDLEWKSVRLFDRDGGQIDDNSKGHGNAVLGVVCAEPDNEKPNLEAPDPEKFGVVGIAPAIDEVLCFPSYGPCETEPLDEGPAETALCAKIADAIWAAVEVLSKGDVLLVEEQLGGNTPVEHSPAVRLAIKHASDEEVIVVEAAGNGATDIGRLEDPSITDPFHPLLFPLSVDAEGKRLVDSGAILVGAAEADDNHDKLASSNFGAGVDCFAWGELVRTCGGVTAVEGSLINHGFGMTSAASAIVAGAALSVQGVSQHCASSHVSPGMMRHYLSTYGTPSGTAAGTPIGVMPDLVALLDTEFPPSIYIRDHVGDPGTGEANAFSSPDLILQDRASSDPDDDFGEDSGTEDRMDLALNPESGVMHAYGRGLKTGCVPADELVFVCYWAPAVTLPTSDRWTLIGSATMADITVAGRLRVSEGMELASPPHRLPYVALIGRMSARGQPAPSLAAMASLPQFRAALVERRNVGFRNYHLVTYEGQGGPTALRGYEHLPFFATGAPDGPHVMTLGFTGFLPANSIVALQVPGVFFSLTGLTPDVTPFPGGLPGGVIVLPSSGSRIFPQFTFAQGVTLPMTLYVYLPPYARGNAHKLSMFQIYDDQVVGRITWELVPHRPRSRIPRFFPDNFYGKFRKWWRDWDGF